MPISELTVVVPCFKERSNVQPMVTRLDAALAGISWEAIFVDDDSPDGTAQAVRAIARHDPRVRCIQRIGRRGLSSAVIEGAMASSSDFIGVIDGDLQHDETRLPDMLAALRAGADLAVGSRHVSGGSAAGLAGQWRHRISDSATRIAQLVLPVRLTDPMSGFFMLRADLFRQVAPQLTGQGFKILLDIVLSSSRRLVVKEVPVVFQPRLAGESKLDVLIALQFAGLLLDKLCHGVVPLRFISFSLVGLLGVGVHLLILDTARLFGIHFAVAQLIATVLAMLGNFYLNNVVTYRTVRLRGPALLRGLALFMLVCSLGAAANIGIAQLIYTAHGGWTPSALVGAVVGAVWNYAISATLVWNRRVVSPAATANPIPASSNPAT